MDSLRLLSNSDLLARVSGLATDERRITLQILDYLREVERRKAYSDLGMKSLFEYAVSHLRYSEGSASRRIAATYALKENPELVTRIQTGQASITSIARIHTTIRRDEKLSEKRWDPDRRKKFFHEMASLPMKDLEKNLFAYLPQASVQERVRSVTADLHELKVYLTSDELLALEDLRAEFGHALKDPGSNSELFRKLIKIGTEKVRAQQLPVEKSRKRSEEGIGSGHTGDQDLPRVREVSGSSVAASARLGEWSKVELSNSVRKDFRRVASPPVRRPALPQKLRREVFSRGGFRCEFQDSTGKRCNSRHYLQVEHVFPYAKGGKDELSNLELVCRDHNLIRGIREFGPEKMKRD